MNPIRPNLRQASPLDLEAYRRLGRHLHTPPAPRLDWWKIAFWGAVLACSVVLYAWLFRLAMWLVAP